jgi:multidrug resistance efflux pump
MFCKKNVLVVKKIISFLVLVLFITSCWKGDIEGNIEKRDFVVKTKSFGSFSRKALFNKTWRLSSSQDINISSQSTGRVKSIFVKEWEHVKTWDVLARLDDTVLNYWLTLEKAKNGLEKTRISYDTTESQLNKQISDMEINLENLKIDEENSKSSLELEKIESSLKKLALDFDKLKITNEKTISWFHTSLEKDFSVFKILLEDVIDFSDKQLWVTTKNRDKADALKMYLWVMNTSQRMESEILLRDLIYFRDNKLVSVNFESQTLDTLNLYIKSTTDWYKKIELLLSSLETTFDNSVESVSSLSATDIATKKWTINWYQTSFTTYNAAFVWLKNSISSFLDTYLSTEASLLKQVELLESDKKIFTKWLDIKLEIEERALNQALENKELTLRSLNTAIIDANITYRQALKELNKLTIRSPISWFVWDILVDVWEEISVWTPTFSVSNNVGGEVDISFNQKELDFVSEWGLAFMNFEGKTFTGTVYSIARNADSNLKYGSKISFTEDIDLVWNIVSIFVPVVTRNPLIPLNIVKINSNWIGTVNILKDNKIEQLDIKPGSIYGDRIEILDSLPRDTMFILNYVDNFDGEKFRLVIGE